MTRIIAFAFVVAVMWFALMFFLGASQAQAQMACGTRDSIVEKLGEKYGEVRRGGGMAGAQAIVELYTSEETGSWTILQTTPNGMTCLVATGELWQDDTGELTPTGDPV